MTKRLLPLGLVAWSLFVQSVAPGATVGHLRCEYRENPLGIGTTQPHLSWQMETSRQGAMQEAYQVLAASSADKLAKDSGDVWDSGKVVSDESAQVEYAGRPLPSGARCEWKVRIWDKDGKPSAWSTPAFWTMGILRPEDWKAQWISTEVAAPPPGPRDEPYARRMFNLDAPPDTAMATVNVMGYYELYVNGTRVGSDELSPALSNYGKRSLYVTYDIQHLLRKGRNCIGLWTSRGWYWETLDSQRNPSVQHNSAIARLQLDMVVNGKRMSIGTDAGWRCKASGRSILGTWSWNNYGGEEVDARREDPKWSDPDNGDAGWHPVTVVQAPAISADAQECPPTRVLQSLPPVSCTDLGQAEYGLAAEAYSEANKDALLPWPYAGKSRYELDFGSNLTGWLKLRLHGLKAGQTVVIRYADKKPPYQTCNQQDRFISAGRPEEEFCSKFNYHGFRWALVEGAAAPVRQSDAVAQLIGADWENRGSFECSNPLFNRMHEVNLWTLHCLSQGGYMSDCPHRERLGYGDGQVSIESCVMNFWMPAFYDKWATDWCDGADPETGYLPHIAPQCVSAGGGPAWGGSAQALTWREYLYYGDKRILARNFDACRRHIEAIESRARNGIVRAFGDEWSFIGDWVPPGRGMDTTNWPPKPAAELFNNCYLLYMREQLAQMADILGRHGEARACRAEVERLRPLIHAAFYDKERQIYALDEQSYQIMPLMTGVVPDDLRETILKKLEDGIRIKRKGHLDTGMLGTYFLLQYLQEIGRNDLLFTVASQTNYPGWGYMLDQGATTWWEQWNGYWSQIHSCFTSLDGWFYQGLAGIRPDPAAPGFKKIIIKPAVVGDLTWVKCFHDSPYGRIVSNWKRDGNKLVMDVTIPPNTTASVCVPGMDGATRQIGSGSYQFKSTLPTPPSSVARK